MQRNDTPSGARAPLDRRLTDPTLRHAIAYWEALRGARLVPPRMALDPAEMRPVLQNCAILERPRPGTLRIRLGGARIGALMGMEVRGLPLRALFDLADRGRITAEVERAMDEPALLLFEVATPAPRYGHPMEATTSARLAILPMSDADFTVNRALYVMGSVDALRTGTPPQRWSITGIEAVPLGIGRPVLTAEAISRPPIAAAAQAADEATSEAHGPLARARFRVIEGGRA
jgi:hypothetical protein